MSGILIFALTWVLISFRRLGALRLDRPAAALLGAVAVVAAGVLSPERALAAVDGRTLLLLVGMMGMGAYLGADGLLDRGVAWLTRVARTPAALLGAVVWGSGVLGALVTNDAVCVLATPFVVALVRARSLPAAPFLLAVATGSNTGSVATLVGNPQNMLCASLGGLAYRDHLVLVGPLAVACLAVNHAVLHVAYRDRLRGDLAPVDAPPPRSGSGAVLAVLGLSVVAFAAGTDLAWTAAAGLAALLVLRRDVPGEEVWRRVDLGILLFFAGLFVVVEGLVATGAPAAVFARFPLLPHADALGWARLAGLFLVGSNVVSNVPFILVVRDAMGTLPDPRLGWELLAVASTFAGNLTLLGSVANVIVAEGGRPVGGLSFGEHLRVGAPIALATTALGAAWLWAFG